MKPIISVIIPIYNVEEYLEETIESVVNQTIGFKDNIELILVNDGSPDNSEKICLKYKELYPDNVIYIKQKNAGVSAARNNGLEHATGKYINFLDSDDKWELNAFEKAVKKLEKNDNISAVLFPMKFFEGDTKKHPLAKAFTKNKIINIIETDEIIQMSSCALIIRKSIIGNHKYSSNIKYSEDTRFLTEIFFENPLVEIIHKVFYLYRKRLSATSAIQTAQINEDWYFVTPIEVYSYIQDLSNTKIGKQASYIQNLLVYDLHWRLEVDSSSVLSKDQLKKYKKILRDILMRIDDKYISTALSSSFWTGGFWATW